MDVFKTRYFKYCRMQLLFVGMWPYQNKLAAMSINICLMVLAAVFINAEIQRIIKTRNQLRLFIEPIPYLLTACGIGIKYLTIWIRSGTMRKTMNRIQCDWHNAALNNEDHILKANAEEGWRFCKLYILTLYVYAFGLLIFQIVPKALNMSISNNSIINHFEQHVRDEFFLDQDKYYALILSYLTVSFILTVVASMAMTVQWIVIINHACGMFAIFGYRLEHVFNVSLRKRDRKDSVKEILVQTVEYHKEIIKCLLRSTALHVFKKFLYSQHLLVCVYGIFSSKLFRRRSS
ncbi:uncharacterized protein LOC143217518 [Lasioglossum baleicum]|uniref:uncharacterized protein LOC143217518 n=1 Tax=Lasioglossum baleicum TaxID=434251 RepID=UPI003FCCAFE7